MFFNKIPHLLGFIISLISPVFNFNLFITNFTKCRSLSIFWEIQDSFLWQKILILFFILFLFLKIFFKIFEFIFCCDKNKKKKFKNFYLGLNKLIIALFVVVLIFLSLLIIFSSYKVF